MASASKVFEVIAPIALNALIAAAGQLADSSGLKAYVTPKLLEDPTEAMLQNLTRAGGSLWSSHFNYFYAGNGSHCPVGDGSKTVRAINSGTDLLIYDKTQGQMPDVDGYLKSVLKGIALQDSSAISLADNINDLLNDRWSEISLDWMPFTKTYAQLTDDSGSVVNIDLLMYTACAQDNNGSNAGFAFYMFTFYGNG